MIWTSEQRAHALLLFNDGASAGDIAPRFGVSRSAVLGMLKRARDNGLTVRASGPERRVKRPRGPGRKAQSPKRAMSDVIEVEAIEVDGCREQAPPVSFDALEAGQCKWPVSGPHGDGYCGQPTGGKRLSFCAHHRALAIQPTTTKLRLAPWMR
jgi:hypothetical protein